MKEMDVYETLRAVMKIADNPLFVVEVEYDLDHIKEIIGDYPMKNFLPLVQTGADTKINKFRGVFYCPNCLDIVQGEFTKTGFIDAIKHAPPLCNKCGEQKRQIEVQRKKEQELQREEEAKKWKEKEDAATKRFIEGYCDPTYSWNKDAKNRYATLCSDYRRTNYEDVRKHIKEMNYYDFLKTPYWVAIAYEVKRKAGFKCAICNSNQYLAAHHRTYDIRGNEIDSLKDLTCLCNDCHEKHHDI